MSKGPDGVMEVAKKGHGLLVPGVEADANHWKEWAGMGIEQVSYVFKFGEFIFVRSIVPVPRSRLVRLIPETKKTKMEERSVRQPRPVGGVLTIERSGRTLHITISADPALVMPETSAIT